MAHVKLIVTADEPALLFASIQDAERKMEPIDVAEGLYSAAFGPKGEPYTIRTDGMRVYIEETGTAPQVEALKAVLLHYFNAIGETPNSDLDLAALLERCSPNCR